MEYISVKQAAEKWNVSVRRVQVLLKENRIKGAEHFGRSWMIPADAEKPVDPRAKAAPTRQTLSADLARMVDVTIVPMPSDDPDAILDTFTEDRFRLHLEGEIAYMRGDFARVIACFERTVGDDAARLRACPLTIAAAICTGNYALFTQIESYLKDMIKADLGAGVTGLAEYALNTAYVSAIVPSMVCDWLKAGDFSAMAPKSWPDTTYKRAKYFQCVGNFEAMLAVAQTALTFCDPGPGQITYAGIYLRISCAVACCALGRANAAERYLMDALNICLPHGFITPFAESATAFGSLLEQCLKSFPPEQLAAVNAQWDRTFVNWISFHNRFTHDNITSMLSLRNYRIALLVARRVPYAEIAEEFNVSIASLKRTVGEIYGTLLISSKRELKGLLL